MTGEQGTSKDELLAAVSFDSRGLVPVVAQDSHTSRVLMLAYANREALLLTLETGMAHYYSRSRSSLWRKGESSGNEQRVDEVSVDCDGDAVLYRVQQTGPACHTGEQSCFFRALPLAEAATDRPGDEEVRLGAAFALLQRVVRQRLQDLPSGSYVTSLQQRGTGYIAQKVVEEAGETIVAALEGRNEELNAEAADLLFHLTVLLEQRGGSLAAVAELLEERHASMSER